MHCTPPRSRYKLLHTLLFLKIVSCHTCAISIHQRMPHSSPFFPILIIPSNQVSSLRRKQLEDEFSVIEGSPLIWDLVAPDNDISASQSEGSIEHGILKTGKPICILTDTSQKIAEVNAEQLKDEEDAIALCSDIDDFILPPYMRRQKTSTLEEKEGNEVEDEPQKGESHLPRGTRTGPKRCLGGHKFEYNRKYQDTVQAMMKYRNRLKIEESLEEINSGKRKRSYGQRGRGRRGGRAYHSKS